MYYIHILKAVIRGLNKVRLGKRFVDFSVRLFQYFMITSARKQFLKLL